MITIEDFKKVEIRMGKIITAERVPEADKLLRLMVDLGEATPRQILSGIATSYPDPAVLVGKLVPILVNLEPRTIRGLESQGMMLVGVISDSEVAILEPAQTVPAGSVVR
ncbi:MAG: methionine--tRNA ligase subunit beta [Patescibacteria group bacterium]